MQKKFEYAHAHAITLLPIEHIYKYLRMQMIIIIQTYEVNRIFYCDCEYCFMDNNQIVWRVSIKYILILGIDRTNNKSKQNMNQKKRFDFKSRLNIYCSTTCNIHTLSFTFTLYVIQITRHSQISIIKNSRWYTLFVYVLSVW